MEEKLICIEYMCVYCGRKTRRGLTLGRPDPGKCPRRKNNMPHRWVINRKIYGKIHD